MHPNVRDALEALHPLFERLMQSRPYKNGDLVPPQGVYLFSEDDKHLYVGRSNSLRKRRDQHCKPYSGVNSASFAALIARMETGIYRHNHRRTPREFLTPMPHFASAFEKAKLRISKMDYRFIAEGDQTRQALLEIYVATALRTPFNDFQTH